MKKVEANVEKQNIKNGICEHCREGIDKVKDSKGFGKNHTKIIEGNVDKLEDSHI